MSDAPPSSTDPVATGMPQRSSWHRWVVLALLALWLLPGTVGRDPWKADEGYTFGLVLHILESGDWLIPTLTDEPFMQKPPMLFDLAAVSARLLEPVLPLHDGARGAVVIFNALTLLALGLTGRLCWGEGKGWIVPVLFIGAPGLIHTQHMLITDVALVTGFAVGQLGLLWSLKRPVAGGMVFGTGVGIAFMAKGVLGPGLMGVAACALPVLFRQWRTLNHLKMLAACAAAFLPWGLIWPALVYQRSPQLFHDWFWDNNIGRFIGTSTVIGSKNNMLFPLRTVSWFALPSLPIAAWMWFARREDRARDAVWQVTLVSFLVMVFVFSVSRQARTIYASPIVVPVALAAGAFVHLLRGRAVRRVDSALAVIYGTVVVGMWIAWLSIVLGRPAFVVELLARVTPAYQPQFGWVAFLSALMVSMAYFGWLKSRDHEDGESLVLNWSAGLVAVYFLGMSLFLPMANSRMGYRHVFQPMRATMPDNPGPVASLGLGESERALFHYLAGVKTRRIEVQAEALDECNWVVIQGDWEDGVLMDPPARGEWDIQYDGRAGGSESFRLYRRRGSEFQN